MLTERDRQVLTAMKRHCEHIVRAVEATHTMNIFCTNELAQDACTFNLLQLGELAKEQLSLECKQRMSSIPWNAIIRMRHKLVHHYEDQNLEVVWDTITHDVPRVLQVINTELGVQYLNLS